MCIRDRNTVVGPGADDGEGRHPQNAGQQVVLPQTEGLAAAQGVEHRQQKDVYKRQALDNDLNTSLAITAIYDALKAKPGAATKLAAIGDFDRVLSLDLRAKADAVRKAQATQVKAVGEFLSLIHI